MNDSCLLGHWGVRMLGGRAAGALTGAAAHPRVAGRIVKFGVGDVVASVARKR